MYDDSDCDTLSCGASICACLTCIHGLRWGPSTCEIRATSSRGKAFVLPLLFVASSINLQRNEMVIPYKTPMELP